MQFQQWHGALAGTWILAAGLIGFLGNVTSLAGAAVVLGAGLLPPTLMTLYWHAPVSVRARR